MACKRVETVEEVLKEADVSGAAGIGGQEVAGRAGEEPV